MGFQNSATIFDQGLYAARSYWLMRLPRTGRSLIRSRERSATGMVGPGRVQMALWVTLGSHTRSHVADGCDGVAVRCSSGDTPASTLRGCRSPKISIRSVTWDQAVSTNRSA